jgi:hypothetical protein
MSDQPNAAGIYGKPTIYTVLHVAYGGIGAYFPALVIPFFIVWQFAQLLTGRRIFLLSMETKPGNSRQHTAKKFAEFMTGIAIGLILRQLGLGRPVFAAK